MKKVPFVHSSFERVENDFYPTIDKRCIYGFLEHVNFTGDSADVCAPDGSGIATALRECGKVCHEFPDALQDNLFVQWVITNPPYKRGLVDEIINRQIKRIADGEVYGVACLLRSNFSFAKSRTQMFRDNKYYAGRIELLFRPWWNEKREAQPIHNYVWQLWRADATEPKIYFSMGEK